MGRMEGHSPRMTGKEHIRRRRTQSFEDNDCTSQSHTLPPDKRQFEKDIAVINDEIQKREAQLKRMAQHSDQEIANELQSIAKKLLDIETQHSTASAEVKATEDNLRKLGDKLVQRRDDASKLMVGLKHKTQAGFDGSIGKLETQLLSKQFSAHEEQKLMLEIEHLKQSKEALKDYTEAKQDVDKLVVDQDQLRKKRDSLYRQKTDHRRSASTLKDKQTELKKLLLEEKQKENMVLRENLKKEIDTLYQKRASIRESFRQQMSAYLTYKKTEQSHKGEESRRRDEDRRATREARQRRREVEHEMAHDHLTEETRLTCQTLISHLTQLAQEDPPPSDGDTSFCPPEGQNAALFSEATQSDVRDGTLVAVPGRFLRRKCAEEEDEQFISSRRRSKRDKKRGGASSAKAFRKFNHNATIVSQFSSLGLTPPVALSDIPQLISQLRDKLALCEARVRGTDSETGDSGVGVEVLSQEELSEYSPKALVTPPPDNTSTDDELLGTAIVTSPPITTTTDCPSDVTSGNVIQTTDLASSHHQQL